MAFLYNVIGSAATAATLLGLLVWLFRTAIETRLKASVEHEFNKKLAEVQAGHRKAEENLKADLRKGEVAIQSLQSGALSGMTSRQIQRDQRSVEAIDQLWAAFNGLAPARGIAMTMTVINYPVFAAASESDVRVRELALSIGTVDMAVLSIGEPWKARPHISTLAWAYFSAYRAIVGFAMLRLFQLQRGISGDYTSHTAVQEVVKAALPHRADYIEQTNISALPHLLDELEQSLLVEFRRMLEGKDSDAESVRQAAAIIAAVEENNRHV